MASFFQRLQRKKIKREPKLEGHWSAWFRSSKVSVRDLLPCFRRFTPSHGHAPPLNHPSEKGITSTVLSEGPSKMTVNDLQPHLDPVKLASSPGRDLITPDIVIADHSDLFISLTSEQEKPMESLLLGFAEHDVRRTTLSLEPSPGLSKSSRTDSFSCVSGHDSSRSLGNLSMSSACRKFGLEGSQRAKYHWTLIRQYICFSFAIRGERRKPWVQLAGHTGSFQTGECGTLLKKRTPEEQLCLEILMNDSVKSFVPLYLGTRQIDGQDFIEMRDLLTGFDPAVSVMDCKLGVRTYLEDELTKAKKKPTMRPDMYIKMVEVDENEPTAEEHEQRAVTKPRYMQWRETISSTATLGFRVEGVKKSDGFASKDYKFTKRKEEVVEVFKQFTDCNKDVIQIYIHRLKDLRKAVALSPFFASHEIIGSSLLMIHDTNGLAGVWMIDFAKTVPLPSGLSIDHKKPWVEGNHEDGYLIGLNNIISCFEKILYQKEKVPSKGI